MYYIEINGFSADELGFDDYNPTDADSASDYMHRIADELSPAGISAVLQLIDENGTVLDETATDWE